MQVKTLLTAAGLAVSASNAFLLPLSEHFDESDAPVTTLPVPLALSIKKGSSADIALSANSESRSLKLDCPGCFRIIHNHHREGHREGHRGGQRHGEPAEFSPKHGMMKGPHSHLELDFAIDHAATSDRLLVNGFELYPRAQHFTPEDMFSAKLVPEFRHHRDGRKKNKAEHAGENKEHKKPHHRPHHHEMPPLPLGFGLRAHSGAHSDVDNLDLVTLDLQIIEVGSRFVNDIPNVQIKLIKTPAGGLMIGDVLITPSEMSSKPEQCTSMLCRWRDAVVKQFGRLRGGKCAGGRPGSGELRFHGRPQHTPPHMHHGHRASWGQLLKNIGAHILLPVAVGIFAGVAASVLGMMVGTFAVFVWRTFFRPASSSTRRHRRRSCHRSTKTEAAAASADEKSGLMAHQEGEEDEVDAPPAYADEQKPQADA